MSLSDFSNVRWFVRRTLNNPHTSALSLTLIYWLDRHEPTPHGLSRHPNTPPRVLDRMTATVADHLFEQNGSPRLDLRRFSRARILLDHPNLSVPARRRLTLDTLAWLEAVGTPAPPPDYLRFEGLDTYNLYDTCALTRLAVERSFRDYEFAFTVEEHSRWRAFGFLRALER